MKDILLKANATKGFLEGLKDTLRNEVLEALADETMLQKEEILQANKIDIASANISKAMLERLELDDKKIALIAKAIREVASLRSPLNRILDGYVAKSGIRIQKVSVPLGVIAVIYESRPNVTSDIFSLCFKSGNVCILKGGKEALNTNLALLKVIHKVLDRFKIPADIVSFIPTKEDTKELLAYDKYIDLVIPRGGEELIKFVKSNSSIPIIKHDKGVCHIYIHSDCGFDMAKNIVLNAKIQKPSACNSIETLLINKEWKYIDKLIDEIKGCIELRGDKEMVKKYGFRELESYEVEYGDNVLNIKLVDDANSAIKHINTYGSNHSDSILTNDYKLAEEFLNEVDSACVYVNASTRFSDGGEFGFGAEVGISTSKLHARGPMGIDSLTTYKYKIYGNGEIRE